MKLKKSSLIGIFLLLLMVTSTLYYIIYSLISHPTLPETNIVDYELDVGQKNIVLRQGRVLFEFFYGKDCFDCREKIDFLESLASRYSDKAFLEKILVNESVPKLRIIGFNVTQNMIFLDERKLEGEEISEEKVMENFCEVTIVPPTECVKI